VKREIDTNSEQWRFECEVRHVLALRAQNRNLALDYLDLVKKRRGLEAGEALERGVIEAWKDKS
jgi:hypothetical protein